MTHTYYLRKIFGWSLDGFGSTTQKCLCEALYATRHLEEAAISLALLNSLDESGILNKEIKEWMGGELCHVCFS